MWVRADNRNGAERAARLLASLAAHAAAAGSRDADERLAAIVEEAARR